nr:PREDICTED: GPI mannosyltransferase 2 [Opisthocomus hoazin]
MEPWGRPDPHLREVVWFAVRCRALTLLLQALFNLLIPDHATDAFSPPRLSEPGPWDQLPGPPAATVFRAAAYSESMFACLAFSAMWHLEKGQSWLSGLLFSLASGVRANGLINAGFCLYSGAKRFALRLQVGPGSVRKLPPLWKQLLSLASAAVLMCAGIFLPFALFQYYAYVRFCGPGAGREPAVSAPLRQLAVVYSYIQDAYWNVGFLRYFELRQIPNFLLALPITLLGSWAAWTYVSANPRHCLTLGLERRRSEEEGKPRAGFCSPAVFVYVVHATALLVFGFCCMHVQVGGSREAIIKEGDSDLCRSCCPCPAPELDGDKDLGEMVTVR